MNTVDWIHEDPQCKNGAPQISISSFIPMTLFEAILASFLYGSRGTLVVFMGRTYSAKLYGLRCFA